MDDQTHLLWNSSGLATAIAVMSIAIATACLAFHSKRVQCPVRPEWKPNRASLLFVLFFSAIQPALRLLGLTRLIPFHESVFVSLFFDFLSFLFFAILNPANWRGLRPIFGKPSLSKIQWLLLSLSILILIRVDLLFRMNPHHYVYLCSSRLLTFIPFALQEELWFRGAVQASFSERFGQKAGLFWGSFLFSLSHVPRLASNVSASHPDFATFIITALSWKFLVGMSLGFIFQRTGNIWVPTSIHAAVNTCSRLHKYAVVY